MDDEDVNFSSDGFSEDDPIDTSETVSYHKLDVLHSRQINRIMKVNALVWLSCLLYVTSAAVLANTVYLQYRTVKWGKRPPVVMRTVRHCPTFFYLEFSMNCLASLGMVFLAIAYSGRVFYTNRHLITEEMVWISVSLITNAFMISPTLQVLLLHSKALGKNGSRSFLISFVTTVMRTMRYCGSGVSIIFYLMATSTSYSLLERRKSKLDYLYFYLPNLLPLMAYQILRLFAFYHGRIILSVIPFSNLVGMIANSIVLDQWFLRPLMYVGAITAFEFYYLSYILIRIREASRLLKGIDYLKFRSKQIGFRFFLLHNLAYYSLFFVFDLIATLSIPRYTVLAYLFDENLHNYANAEWGGFSFEWLNFFYQFFTAYTHLPPDAHGFLGWFMPSTRYQMEEGKTKVALEPMSLSVTEPSAAYIDYRSAPRTQLAPTLKRNAQSTAIFDLQPHSNSLSLPLHIGLFNFSWLIYDWMRNGVLSEDQFRWIDNRNLVVKAHIIDKPTDSSLMIVSVTDRIIVAFKGTTSFVNVRTDAKAVKCYLHGAIPTYRNSEHEILRRTEWRRARVHTGFLEVYAILARRVVDCIADMISVNPRPILLTGHSLGGALATLCSIDLMASLDLDESDILISTFGSPRVGNVYWAELYDEFLPIHWRFGLEKDLISTMPKLGYRHVGKRVLMTENGNIFLDPNGLEGVLWSGNLPDMLYHRKPAYMYSLTRFCSRYTDYKPDFWGHALGHADKITAELQKVDGSQAYEEEEDMEAVKTVSTMVHRISQRKSSSRKSDAKRNSWI